MKFFEAVQSCLNNYANFEGRASRSEYWYWVLFCMILGVIAGIIDGAVFHVSAGHVAASVNGARAFRQVGPTGLIINLATLIPSIAVTARRLHDVDRSGWWMLIVLTIVGIFFPLLYWYCQKGDDGINRFGADPLQGGMPRR